MPTAASSSLTFSQYTEKHLAFDISNICNAQCYYCQTGFRNRNKIPPCNRRAKFIEVPLFERVLRYLKAQGFVEEGTKIHLYNWGEPMLHPEFAKIIEISKKENCLVALSTNAAVLPKLPDTFDASNIGFVKFSMCGFSQASYDKIHRFNFERIKENIEIIVRTFRQHGFVGEFYIYFHVYQFNLHELQAAYDFAKTLSITCHPVFAVINDWEKLKDYLQKHPAAGVSEQCRAGSVDGHRHGKLETDNPLSHGTQFDHRCRRSLCSVLFG